LVDMFTII